jgi:hypothetical protein
VSVPNLATGGLSKDKSFSVQAISVVGSIGLNSSGKSESDWYSIAGQAGDIVTIEVMSRALKRYSTSNATSIDSVVRLHNASGQLVQTFGRDAVNDDEFESSDSLLMDITLPTNGTFFIEVDTFRRQPGDPSYTAAVALRQQLEARRDDPDGTNPLTTDEAQLLQRLVDSLEDTDTGNYELLIYRFTSASSIDGIDDLQGRQGVDQLDGGPGDDYSLGMQLIGAASVNQGSLWTGSYLFTDRGGFSWTATVNYGDGSSSIITSPAGTSRGTQIPLSHLYANSGPFTVTVTVTSDDGLAQTRTHNVQVNHVAPTVTLSGPTNGVTGTPLVYQVTATDAAGGTSTLSYSWTITRNGSPFATQTGGLSYYLTASLPGTYTVTVTVNDGSGGVTVRSRDVVIVSSVTAARVASVVLDDGTAQRSMIRSVTVKFDKAVTIQSGAFSVVKRGAGGGAVALKTPVITTDSSGRTIVTLTFASAVGNSLADGNYELRIDSTRISNSGLFLDGDGDGTAGGDYLLGSRVTDKFYRLFGDGNGDRVVDTADTTLFTSTYRKLKTDLGFNSAFDSDDDGDVDATDYAFMRNQLNKTMSFL